MSPLRLKARSKYGAKATVIDNVYFDSAKEAARYLDLKLLLRAGAIKELELHPKYPICGKPGECVAYYEADFRYRQNGETVVEDVKSKATRTKLYRLKKKLVESQHGIEIREV